MKRTYLMRYYINGGYHWSNWTIGKFWFWQTKAHAYYKMKKELEDYWGEGYIIDVKSFQRLSIIEGLFK